MSLHIDPILPPLTILSWTIILTGIILHRLKQPHVVGYILLGALIGPRGLGFISEGAILSQLGSVGVVLLLFFVGMEIQIQRLVEIWKIVVFGTVLQILISVVTMAGLGWFLDWPLGRILLLGFVISLSSTAVVIKLLQDRQELETESGRAILGVLLAQDIAVIPMIIVLSLFASEQQPLVTTIKQIIGGILLIGLTVWIGYKKKINLPFKKILTVDSEMEVFGAAALCLGLALLSAIMGLSTALGAFVGGMLVSAASETHWVDTNLNPFRVVFMALFFVSVGMLVDFNFLLANYGTIITLVISVLVLNTVINALIFRVVGMNWQRSIYAAAHLAQIGEFSFVLAAIGLSLGIINNYSYQATIQVIALTLCVGPLWIFPFRKLAEKKG
jgi:CPA2 family monovalent cation:H+ antiporter-2